MATVSEAVITIKVNQDEIFTEAKLNKGNETITIKDADGLDFRIENYPKNKLDDLIAVLTAISTSATTEFAA
ncbi:hypothetical protein V9L05_01300 [Bernardetia sp. Wsw4-3y2]|uniref:hypothetical protein n=1 Tax=Bernardetia sp. Wsw4-3y2 TaxID=3127471 RepID=UPI0030D61797